MPKEVLVLTYWKYGLLGAKLASTPIDYNQKLFKTVDED